MRPDVSQTRSTLKENDQTSIQKSDRKHVHFSYVTIREYEVIPSDNPAVAFGGPGIEVCACVTSLFAFMDTLDYIFFLLIQTIL